MEGTRALVPGLIVKVEMNQAAREFPQLARSLPSLTRNAINRTATWAEREATAAVAKQLKLPVKFVRNRLTRDGSVKERRTTIRRATTANLNATLEVYMRGLPVYQVALPMQRRAGGVKAKGGRFYPGAFRPQKGSKEGLVFKRMGPRRVPLMMPKIGLRERLHKEFDKRISGAEGIAFFRREYAEQLKRGAARYGVKA